MITISQRLLRYADFAFIIGLTFSLFLGNKVVPVLLIAGLLPIPFVARQYSQYTVPLSILRVFSPAFLYFAYSIISYFLYTGLNEEDQRPVNPDLELYIVAIGLLVLGAARGLLTQDLSRRFHQITPWALIASFLLLSALFTIHLIEGTCVRVQGAAAWPFIPALLFGTLSMLSLVGWQHLGEKARILRLSTIALSIVVVTTLTASRGVAVAQITALSLLLILSLNTPYRGKMPSWKQFAGTLLVGMLLSGAIGVTTGCGLRMISMFSVMQQLVPKAIELSTSLLPKDQAHESDGPSARILKTGGSAIDIETIKAKDLSAGERFEMWETAIVSIRQAPLLGHGSLYLQNLITERYGYQHNHNQYLSWLVMGGVVYLSIGLLFLFLPWFVSKGLPTPDRLMMTVAVSIFWGVAMVFDSYFNLKFYTHYFCLLVGFLFALSQHSLEDRKVDG